MSRVPNLSGSVARKLSGRHGHCEEVTHEMNGTATGDQADEIPVGARGARGAADTGGSGAAAGRHESAIPHGSPGDFRREGEKVSRWVSSAPGTCHPQRAGDQRRHDEDAPGQGADAGRRAAKAR